VNAAETILGALGLAVGVCSQVGPVAWARVAEGRRARARLDRAAALRRPQPRQALAPEEPALEPAVELEVPPLREGTGPQEAALYAVFVGDLSGQPNTPDGVPAAWVELHERGAS
jgi:hypothetical protein